MLTRGSAPRAPLACLLFLTLAAAVSLAGCGSAGQGAPPAPKRIALVYRARDGALVLASVTGRDPRTLGSAAQALLSPDGTRVIALGADGVLTLYRTARASDPRVVATLAAPDWASSGLRLLGWSPDSRYVALSGDELSGQGEQGALLVVNVASGRARTVATGNFLGASFAPTLPDRLVYSQASLVQLDAGESLLYVTTPGGRGTRELTRSGLASSPTWSRRGILFARLAVLGSPTSSPRYELWLVQPNGRGLRRVGAFSAGPPMLDGASAIAVSASGKRAVADFYSPYSARPLVDAWTIDLTARGAVAQAIRLRGGSAVAKGISRNGKAVLAVARGGGGGGGEVISIPWGGGRYTVLASDASDPSWNH
jgi:hypothetical protein